MSAADPQAAQGGSDPNRWWTLSVVCVAIFMLLLDVTIVNVALPSIQTSLDASFSDLQWVVDAYALTLAALLLTAGSVADLVGRRLVFAIGLVEFSLASLASGLAGTPLVLNLARGAQGVGAAMMFATSLALLAQAFSGRERGTAFGIWGATTGAAVAVGPLVGGALTDWFGWEWIFFINVPIGLVATYVTLTRVSESSDPSHGGVDWAGLVTFSGGLFLLVFGLIRGNPEGWGSPLILGCLIGAAVLLIAFVLVELYGRAPMFELALFRRPAFTGAALAAFGISAGIFASFLFMSLYLQNILGYSPLETGVRFLPVSLLAFVVAPISGKLSAQMPVRWLIGGGLLAITVALVLMAQIDASSDWTALLPGFILAGIGIGLTNAPLASTAIGVVPRERSGMASGINATFRQVGIATGIATFGAIFQHQVENDLKSNLSHGPLASKAGAIAQGVATGQGQRALGNLPAAVQAQAGHAARSAFVSGLTDIFLLAAAITLVCGVAATVLIRQRDFEPGAVQAAAPAD
jgi:EmrB/QacA subfamily drug resistance transporter